MKPSTAVLAALLPLSLLGAAPSAHALELLGFNVPSTYVLLGSLDASTVPTPLMLVFDGPVLGDTFVGLTSSDPSVLGITGGGTTVPNASSNAFVLLTGLDLGNAVLTAQFNGVEYTAAVSVVTAIPAVPEPATYALWALGLALVVQAACKHAVSKAPQVS